MKWLLICLLLTGCEAIQTRGDSGDVHDFEHDCVLIHADGTTMTCNQHLTRDQAESDEDSGVSVVLPVPAAGQ